MLMSCEIYSQSITITEKEARNILTERRKSQSLIDSQSLLIHGLETEIDTLQAKVSSLELTNHLIKQNYDSCNLRVENIKPNTFRNILIGIGLFGLGFLFGGV